MAVTFYPKRLLITAIVMAVFGATLSLATDLPRAATAVGLISVVAYVALEVFMTANPAIWWRDRHGSAESPPARR